MGTLYLQRTRCNTLFILISNIKTHFHMANIVTELDELNNIFNEYGKLFEQNTSPSFHDLLWKLIVNRAYNDKVVVFAPVLPTTTGRGIEVGLAEHGSKGYFKTNVALIPDVPYNQASDILEELTAKIFGISGELYDHIFLRSLG